MPISLSNLTQILMFKAKHVASKHKKKIIFAIVLFLAAYVAKKKLTVNHVITFVGGITRLVQTLPLPQAPKLRNSARYEHPDTVPLKGILQAIRLDDIKKKIARKQAGWQELKQSIINGVMLTMVLYNQNSLYFLLQNKYQEEFMDLQASTQFQQAMYILRKKFIDEIPLLMESIRQTLFPQYQRIQLTKQYDIQELDDLFARLLDRIYEPKYDIRKEGNYSLVNKVMPSVKNLFVSPYEYVEEKSHWLGKVGGSLLKFASGMFSLGGILPQGKVEISSQRYYFTKIAYLQPLKKAASELEHVSGIAWPNQQSKQLFGLLLEEMQFTITSLNFSTFLKAYSSYNMKILHNRLSLLFQVKKRNNFKFSQLLPLLYKIIQEEFLKPNQYELRQKYHNEKLKKALIITSQQQSQIQQGQGEEQKTTEQHLLEQIQLKNAFLFLQKQLELKIFNERSGFVMRPRGPTGQKDSEQMKKLLTMMSGSQALNSTEQ